MGKTHFSLSLHPLQKIFEATFGQLVGRSINFLIPFVILHLYPIGKRTDNFFLAFSIAFFFFGTIANLLTDASIPRAVRDQPLLNGKRRLQLSATLAVVAIVIVSLISLISDDYPPFSLLVGVGLMVIGAVFSAFSTGVLNAQNSYMWPGVFWGLRALPLIYWWFARPTDQYLGWLMLTLGVMDILRAYCLERLAQYGTLYPTSDHWNSLQGYFSMVIAGMIGGINPIIDRLIAGQADAGGVSLLEAGERFYGILATLATIGVMSVILVKLSHKNNKIHFERLYQRILVIGIFWAGSWALLGLIGWNLIGGWLLEHLVRADDYKAALIDTIYLYYLAGLPAFVLGLICVRVYLARGQQASLIILGLVSAGTNAGLSLGLFHLIGIAGISLATTVVYTLTTVIMIIHLSRLNRSIPFDKPQSLY